MKRFGSVTVQGKWLATEEPLASLTPTFTTSLHDETPPGYVGLLGYMLYDSSLKKTGTIYPDKQVSKNAVPLYVETTPEQPTPAALPDKLNIKQEIALRLAVAAPKASRQEITDTVNWIMTLK